MPISGQDTIPKQNGMIAGRSGAPTSGDGDVFTSRILAQTRESISILDENAFARDCLARCLREIEQHYEIKSFNGVAQWGEARRSDETAIVLLCASGAKATELAIHRDLATVRSIDPDALCIVMSDNENPDQMMDTIEKGGRGFIPSSIGLEVAVEAIRLVRAGGTFIPASALLKSRTSFDQAALRKENERGLFTARQAEVVKALRRGQPNKLIAYELNMGECTVKVHIRNIMKKLNARNRTEVAFLTNDMFPSESDRP
ncbi:response regulator transcription factor [Kaistia geumhonensis]|uniref:DNA-binding NarL/FixJ family response regulator n=1 Tax=Kaistia geumhonensis TaxID=410839 RepID=A0ABU0M9F6_9HYPH|nr:response regulator transcription factor [Kaistia geumhonensis]MCX5480733.1 response regulator transcription factor [Kaistia geumhonensis]MDQ0517563.1 DNA-binding NarL/FixJ family response regulator [Kaistia geumhonensis]